MRKSFALMMLMFSGFALGEGRSADAAQAVVPQREIAAPGAVAAAAIEPRAALRAQSLARRHYAQAHGVLQTTLALYMQGLSSEEQLMRAERALADAERTCAAYHESGRGPGRRFDAGRYLL